MTRSPVNERTFKRAIFFSAVFHAVLFTVIAISPSMTKPVQKGHDPLRQPGRASGPGRGRGTGGGGGGGSAGAAGRRRRSRPPAKKETLRDLTVAFEGQARGQAVHDLPCRQAEEGQEGPGRKEGRDHEASAESAGQPGGRRGRNRRRHGRRVRRVGAQDRARRRARRGRIGRIRDRIRGPDRTLRFPLPVLPPDHLGPGLLELVHVARRPRGLRDRSSPPSISRSSATARSRTSRSRNRAASSRWICRPSGPSRSPRRSLPFRATTTGDYLGIHLIFEHSK